MHFDTRQAPHQQLRSRIAEKRNRVVFWVGSGLSVPANLPTWSQLKDLLIDHLRVKSSNSETEYARRLSAAADKADKEKDYWIAFQILKKNLGGTSFCAAIREALKPAPTVQCPEVYKYIWRIGTAGILNLNLDGFATKALGEVKPGYLPTEFSGKEVAQFTYVLKELHQLFIANLHGRVEDSSSWILTKPDLNSLLTCEKYQHFIQTCLTTHLIVFIGIRANDLAVRNHLEVFTRREIDIGSHYWITNENDPSTDRWAEDAGIQIIRYKVHEEIPEFFEDILNFNSPQVGRLEIPGSVQRQFKLYEAACLLVDEEPAWPIPTQRARDRYVFLVSEIKNDKFGDDMAFDFGGAEFRGNEHEFPIRREDLREGLEAMNRPLPPFLREP